MGQAARPGDGAAGKSHVPAGALSDPTSPWHRTSQLRPAWLDSPAALLTLTSVRNTSSPLAVQSSVGDICYVYALVLSPITVSYPSICGLSRSSQFLLFIQKGRNVLGDSSLWLKERWTYMIYIHDAVRVLKEGHARIGLYLTYPNY